jgi:hypothetical protein
MESSHSIQRKLVNPAYLDSLPKLAETRLEDTHSRSLQEVLAVKEALLDNTEVEVGNLN